MVVLVPEFEVERVCAETDFERVESYPEYPGLEHPMRILGRVLAQLGVTGKIGADQDGYPGVLGYEGPPLSEVTASAVAPLGAVIESMLARKSDTEIALIRESARWCAHAHRLLQEYTRPGATEAEASLRAGHEATVAMLEALGDNGQQASSDGVSAGYRGQIGLRSSWAHAVAHNIEFKAGDVLVTESTTEAFNILLPLLGGIVTDNGGLLSHAAIVAREYGIPGVVGTREATERIANGVRIRVDGDAGEVTVLG